MKKRILFLTLASTIVLSFAAAATAASIEVPPSTHFVKVNGEPVSVAGYLIPPGNNFFMLRDIAYVLNGTGSQFNIGWDGATSTITITTGEAYQPVGTEMRGVPEGRAEAVRSDDSVIIDGEEVTLIAYRIDGSNFFQLRDLGDALGFDVAWDGATETVLITTQEEDDQTRIEIEGRLFETTFIGMAGQFLVDLLPGNAHIEIFRVENAYEYFRDHPPGFSVQPFVNIPGPVELGQVFAVVYTMQDGSVFTMFYRSSGYERDGMDMLEAFRVVTYSQMEIEGRVYETTSFGTFFVHLQWGLTIREIIRIENAYEDFSDHPTTGNMLPTDNLIEPVEVGQVFVTRMIWQNGDTRMSFYRFSGLVTDWGGDTTEEFIVSE